MGGQAFDIQTGRAHDFETETVAARVIASSNRLLIPGGTINERGERLAQQRVLRPGAIILPRLQLASGEKKPEPIAVLVRGPTQVVARADSIEMRLSAREARLVRITERGKPETAVLGGEGKSTLIRFTLPRTVAPHLDFELEATTFLGDPTTVPDKEFSAPPKSDPTPGTNAIRTPPSRPWWNDEPHPAYPRYKVTQE